MNFLRRLYFLDEKIDILVAERMNYIKEKKTLFYLVDDKNRMC